VREHTDFIQPGISIRIMFQDEARFGRINDPRRCWAPAGIRPHVPMQLVREYTYVFAAVCPIDGAMDSLILPEVNTTSMSLFLEELSQRHTHEFILLFLDGAGWHKSNNLQIPTNIRLVPLPPYSPQLNPVEHIWEEIREKWFPNLVFDSLDAVESVLLEALITLENDKSRVQSLTSFDWIISNELTAT
jgi:transposase